MQLIHAIVFEPVGCLAEFGSEAFDQIAVELFHQKTKTTRPGSVAYWRFISLLHASGNTLDAAQMRIIEDLELRAVEAASAYEDVSPALVELKSMDVTLAIASSLSNKAISRFLTRFSLQDVFSYVWDRNTAGGVKQAPLAAAIRSTSPKPEHVMFLTDTAEGLRVAKSAGVNSILMMNDPDDAMKLASHNPSGGIVSLHELPDVIRFVAAQKQRSQV